MKNNIWIWVHKRDGQIDDMTFGLIEEARQLTADMAEPFSIVAIAVGDDLNSMAAGDQKNTNQLNLLAESGVDQVMHFKGLLTSRYHGEYFAKILSMVMEKESPLFFLMAHDADTADLGPRLATLLPFHIVTRAVDLCVDDQGIPTIVRPIANGYLFETLTYNIRTPLIVTFLPNVPVSSGLEPGRELNGKEGKKALLNQIDLQQDEEQHLKTRIVNIIEAAPENLDITEADIIVAAGRGVGKRDGDESAMDVINDLAGLLGASVAGTRPVIDRNDLPFERQIGQTGKIVTPQLIINCGISGANEYTAGIEKSKKIIAINSDPEARIFRFADLGIIGDLHEILPLLNKLLIKLKEIEIE